MNIKMIGYIVGRILCVMSALMLLPLIIAVAMREDTVAAYLITIGVLLISGILLSIKKPSCREIYAREGLVIVALTWILMSLLGALPFFISGEIPSYCDAVFETVSGFTTTGSTILTDIEALSYSNLFWRSFTHWIGGMGVLVFVLMILPQSETHSMYLMRAEIPGIKVGKIVSKIRVTASILYGIYIALTLLEVALLFFGGMPLFDSFVHSFGTAGTGGFSMKNASIAYYDSSYIHVVITVFMLLFSINFNIYYMILIGQVGQALRNEEMRWFLITVGMSVTMISINIYHLYNNLGITVRDAAFQVASIISTTGYSTSDFTTWPDFSKALLVLLMFIGACAGSTGGGIKMARVIILIKSGICELRKLVFPHSVNSVKLESKTVEPEVLRGVNAFFAVYMTITSLSILIVSLEPFGVVSNTTAVIACISNIGPGLDVVGPIGNFAEFSVVSKLVLMFDMLAGRLEIFPMLVLFFPSLWKR